MHVKAEMILYSDASAAHANKTNRADYYFSSSAKSVISPRRSPPHPPLRLISASAHCVDSISAPLISPCEEMLAGRRRRLVASRRLNQVAGLRAARRSPSDLYLSLVIFSDAARSRHCCRLAVFSRTPPHIGVPSPAAVPAVSSSLGSRSPFSPGLYFAASLEGKQQYWSGFNLF